MLTIEELRSALKDANNDYAQARAAAIDLAGNKDAALDELQKAQSALDQAKARKEMLESELNSQLEDQSANLQQIREKTDQIQSAAKRFRSSGDFLQAVASARTPDSMDARLREYANIRSSATGQNITTDADGGYLVPPDYAAELLNVATSQSVLFPEVTRVPVAGNRLAVNVLDADSRKDHDSTNSIKGRNGGLLAYWKGEAAEMTASQMKFTQQTTNLNKLTGLCYATDELLEDVPALSAYIAQGFADEFTFKIDDAILNGTGSSMPQGILHSGNSALITISKESGQADGSLLIGNILKMWNAMPAANRANAKWYINQDLEILLYQLLMPTGSMAYAGKDSGAEPADVSVTANFGVPIFVPAGGLSASPNGLLLGRPIVPVEQAPAVGAKGDISLIDLSQYRWIDKGGVDAQTSIHVRFVYGEQAFRFTYRAGGKPIWPNAISAYTGSTSRSPYVCLGARTSG